MGHKFCRCTLLFFILIGLLTSGEVCGQNSPESELKEMWMNQINDAVKSSYDSLFKILIRAEEKAQVEQDQIWFSDIRKIRIQALINANRIGEASDVLVEWMATNTTSNVQDSLYYELQSTKIEFYKGSVHKSYSQCLELIKPLNDLNDHQILSDFYLHLAQIFNLAKLDNHVRICIDKINDMKGVSEDVRIRSDMLEIDLIRRTENKEQILSLASDFLNQLLETGYSTLLPEMYLIMADITADSGDLPIAQNYLRKCLEKAESVGYERYSQGLFRLADILSEEDMSEALLLAHRAFSSTEFNLRDAEGFSHLNSAMSIYVYARNMDDQTHEVIFDGFKRLWIRWEKLTQNLSKIRLDQESNNLFNDFQNDKNGRAFYEVLMFFAAIIIVGGAALFIRFLVIKNKNQKASRQFTKISTHFESKEFHLDREIIQESIDKKLNTTDWEILEWLAKDQLMTNKLLAEKIGKSEEGISSSLRKMYDLFDIEVVSNKKIALLNQVASRSNKE